MCHKDPWGGAGRLTTVTEANGWFPQTEYNVIVPRPSVAITSPASFAGTIGSTYDLSFNILNNGIGAESASIGTLCNGWPCSFVGYTANTPVTLTEGGSYNVVLRVTVPTGASTNNVGIRVTYDDGYGLVAIAPQTADGLVQITLSNYNDATFVSQTVPNPMCLGQTYTASVSMRNSGTTTWTAANNYKLGSQNPQDNTFWGGRVLLSPSDSIAPGQTKNFVFTVTPSATGTHNFQWRMLREMVEWFGQTTPNVAVQVNICTTTTTTTFAQADLLVPAIRHTGSTIYYDLRNSGGAGAAASKSSLTIDGSFIREDNVAAIAGGSLRQESFNYTWSCSGASDIVRVCADSGHVVPESDETNNCNNVTWNCAAGTTTTTTTITSTTTTTLIGPVPHDVTVTLKYTVRDFNAESVKCSVWTNISSAWRINATQNVGRDEEKKLILFHVPAGMYGWTVNCSEGVSHNNIFAYNGVHTSPAAPFAPEKIRIFYVIAPPAAATTTTTTTVVTSTTTTTLAQADLLIPDIWYTGNTIYYNLANFGGSAAAASRSSLTIDGSFIREDNDAAISSGVNRQESFAYSWVCSGVSDIVRVCADSGHAVPESDETNNCRNETWVCPTTTTTTTTTTITTTTTLPSIIPGNSDVVLITDLSGTMMYCLNGGHSGCSSTDDTCPNTPPHANGCTAVDGSNPVRYDYAQKLNKDFVDRVLSRPNNKVALLAFGESAGTTPPFRVGLSSDATYLKTQINQYIPGSATLGTGTGTCVAIRAARKVLEDQSSSTRNKYIILLSDGVANTRCTGTYPALTHYQPREYCCSTSCSGKGDYVSECPGYDLIGSASCNCAHVTGGYKFACFSKYDTVSMANSKTDACDAKTSLGANLWIYTIGMFNPGFAASCYWGKTNLDDISACGGGQTFIGTTPSELENIYNKF